MNYERWGIATKRREERDGFPLDKHDDNWRSGKSAVKSYHVRIVERFDAQTNPRGAYLQTFIETLGA
jgi:hypothetical protein